MSDHQVLPVDGGDHSHQGEGIEDIGRNSPAGELPKGITKEIVSAAPSENWKNPKAGDEVTVHYIGTLQSNGSEFDSSRGRAEPFVFSLGTGQVIKGWNLAVATMRKGEVAKFTVSPEFGYGDAGSPPTIPEKATLVFEVELISWCSKDDLFGDEGVIKTQVKEGAGWRTPKDGDEVLLSLKALAADGSLIEEKADHEYKVGSRSLGSISKACEKALVVMKKGELASLHCSKDYAYGDSRPDGATLELKLEEIYETKDVSFSKDGSVMKKRVREGEGWETPKDTAKVTLSVEAATDGAAALPGFVAKVLVFTAGDGEVCDALECASAEMKKGERAMLTVKKVALVAEAQLGFAGLAAERVVLTVMLTEFEKAKETYSMSEEEKIEFGLARKEVGTTLFKSGRFAMALQRFIKVADLFSYVDGLRDENKAKAKELKKVCELNKAACYLKLLEYVEARQACDTTLKDEKHNIKALYRRAQAEYGLSNFAECMRDCKRVVGIDPQNRDARALLKQAEVGQKEVDKKSKGLFADMCKDLGKGPIPEPGGTQEPDRPSWEGSPWKADGCEGMDGVEMRAATPVDHGQGGWPGGDDDSDEDSDVTKASEKAPGDPKAGVDKNAAKPDDKMPAAVAAEQARA